MGNEKIKEEVTMEMTIDLMNSKDYKDRFKWEYAQTLIRLRKLNNMLNKYDEGTFYTKLSNLFIKKSIIIYASIFKNYGRKSTIWKHRFKFYIED